jgi:hypothetical protein
MASLASRPLDFAISTDMPGASFKPPLPALTPHQSELTLALRRDVQKLAAEIGERNVYRPVAYAKAAAWLAEELGGIAVATGNPQGVMHQEFTVKVPGPTEPSTPAPVSPARCVNLWLDLPTRDPAGPSALEAVVVGSHYDSVEGCPGANDNATGIAAVLAIGRAIAALPPHQRPARTVRLACFANEEPPWFWTRDMGSLVLAEQFAREQARSGPRIVAMLTPETIGCYSDEPGSQLWPAVVAPVLRKRFGNVGDFIAFVGLGRSSLELTRQVTRAFRSNASFPSLGAVLPNTVVGAGASDHWSFWKQGVPSLMITDTAPFRYKCYHTNDDRPDKPGERDASRRIDFERCARVVEGLVAVVRDVGG